MHAAWAATLVTLAALAAASPASSVALAGEDTPAAASRPVVDTDSALAVLRSALPAGWKITRTSQAAVPDGWTTRDGGGFLVEGDKGATRFRTWFLPRDWIGICPRAPEDVWRRHGIGILVSDTWKSITLCEDQDFVQELCGKLGQSASLLSSGEWISQKLYGARVTEVDASVRELVGSECVTTTDRDGAVASLLVLGVPAPSLFRELAARGFGDTAEHCAWVLGQFPGRETVETLSRVVADAASDDKCVKSAAMALERLADPASGPSLLKALGRVRWSEAAIQVGQALGRIRAKDAGPVLLRRMRSEENVHYKAEYAKPLASICYEPAIPDLRAMSEGAQFTAEWILGERDRRYLGDVPAVALFRMTGKWGAPAEGARIALLPPKSPEMGKTIVVALVIENVGDGDLEEIPILEGTAYVDGVAVPREPRMYNGCFTLPPSDVGAFERDLTKAITKPGAHRVRYEAGAVVSNEIEIEVGDAAK